MKSTKQIIQDKPKMDTEQQECVQRCSVPKTWTAAPELNDFFDRLNKNLFKAVLPKVPCYWSPPVRGFLGRCHARVHPKTQNMHSVALEFPCNGPDGTLYETMIHEMVHVYQTVMGIPFGHNRLFHSINKRKRIAHLKQHKEAPEPLLYPPRKTKKNCMWHRASDIEDQLQALSELLFDKPVLIPTCWWHATKTKTPYTLESYWCHTEQNTKPNILEVSKKNFSPNKHHLIYILCTIASWKAVGNHNRRKYRNELFIQKKRAYFGDPKPHTQSFTKGPTIDIARLRRILHRASNQESHDTSRFISGTVSSGKTQMIHNLYTHVQKEGS